MALFPRQKPQVLAEKIAMDADFFCKGLDNPAKTAHTAYNDYATVL
jgi:hypothetical protein